MGGEQLLAKFRVRVFELERAGRILTQPKALVEQLDNFELAFVCVVRVD